MDYGDAELPIITSPDHASRPLNFAMHDEKTRQSFCSTRTIFGIYMIHFTTMDGRWNPAGAKPGDREIGISGSAIILGEFFEHKVWTICMTVYVFFYYDVLDHSLILTHALYLSLGL